MKKLVGLLVFAAGCASEPAGPTLPMPVTLTLADYEEEGGILPIVGTLELTVEPTGAAKSVCRREILTDVERKGELNHDQLVELVARVEAWTSRGNDPEFARGKPRGVLVYGTRRAAWGKDDTLEPELNALVIFLRRIPPTLRVLQHKR
jgi:hypothetical protein